MGRPKGSKNKQTIEEEPKVTAEEIEIDELLDPPAKEKKFIGYNPVTGAEIWE